MMLRILSLSILLFALFVSDAQAQSYYRWIDDAGEVHYGQSVPPEFADYGYDRLGPDGTVRERIEPALSPEEMAERRRQRARQARLETEQRNQETRDRMLRATYGSEQDLKDAMEMQIAGINSQRASTLMALELVENRFETLVGRAAGHSREGRTVPEPLQQSISETRRELRRLRADLVRLDERETETRERYMADLARYRELTGRSGEDG